MSSEMSLVPGKYSCLTGGLQAAEILLLNNYQVISLIVYMMKT